MLASPAAHTDRVGEACHRWWRRGWFVGRVSVRCQTGPSSLLLLLSDIIGFGVVFPWVAPDWAGGRVRSFPLPFVSFVTLALAPCGGCQVAGSDAPAVVEARVGGRWFC